MAESKCIKCEGTNFEMVDSFNKSIKFVQCAECGSVIGVVETLDITKRFNDVISKCDLSIKNEMALERVMNIKESNIVDEIKNIKKTVNESLETVQTIYDNLYRHGIR